MKTRSVPRKRVSIPSTRLIEYNEFLQASKTAATTKPHTKTKTVASNTTKAPVPLTITSMALKVAPPAVTVTDAITPPAKRYKTKQILARPQNVVIEPFTPAELPSREFLAPFRLKHQNQSSGQDLERDYDTSQHYAFNDPTAKQRFIDDYSRTHQKTIHYLESTEPALVYQEQHILMAPTAILQNAEANKAFGAFTTIDIYVPARTQLVLGHYKGLVKERDHTTDLSSFVFDYIDDLIVDADQHRNWIAMVNTAISEKTANVKVRLNEDNREIEYYVDGGKDGAFIPAGTQLLTYYGQKFDHYENKRFLKPEDTWEDSDAIFKRYKNQYQRTPQRVDPDFLALFAIDPATLFALPNLSRDKAHPNTCYLAYQPSDRSPPTCFLPQNLQENITPLMMACWQGDEERMQHLLQRGANINTQSSISGQSPLHILVRANLSTDEKITLLRFMQRHGADLLTQDKDEKSLLHWAVAAGDEALARELIAQKSTLLARLNSHSHDALEDAIRLGHIEISQFLLSTLINASKSKCEDNLTYYLEKDHDFDPEESEDTHVELTWQSRLATAFTSFCEQHPNDHAAINAMAAMLNEALQPFLLQAPYCDWDFSGEMSAIQSRYVSMSPNPHQPTAASAMAEANGATLSSVDTTKHHKLLAKLAQLQSKTPSLASKALDSAASIEEANDLFALSEQYYQLSEEFYQASAFQQFSDIQAALTAALTLATTARAVFVHHGAIDNVEEIDPFILTYQQSLQWYEHMMAANQSRHTLLIAAHKTAKSAADIAAAIAEGRNALAHYHALLTHDASADRDMHTAIRATQRLIVQCEKQTSAMLAMQPLNAAPPIGVFKNHKGTKRKLFVEPATTTLDNDVPLTGVNSSSSSIRVSAKREDHNKKLPTTSSAINSHNAMPSTSTVYPSFADIDKEQERKRKLEKTAPIAPPSTSAYQTVVSYGIHSWKTVMTVLTGTATDQHTPKAGRPNE